MEIGLKNILVEFWVKNHCCHCASIASMELAKRRRRSWHVGVVVGASGLGRRASGEAWHCLHAILRAKKKGGRFATLDVKYFEFKKYLIRLNSIKTVT